MNFLADTETRVYAYIYKHNHHSVVVMKSLSRVRLLATPWTVAHQGPLSIEFPRQEYWNGLPFPTLRDLPDPGTAPASLAFPALAGGFFHHCHLGSPDVILI